MSWRLPVDHYLIAIITTVVLAFVLPSPTAVLPVLSVAAQASIVLLFFLYGVRLAPGAVWRGLLHWRLQLLVLAATFGLFPLLGLALQVLVPAVLSSELYVGVLFLCLVPSTVQSSVAFTGLAGGNVAAAVSATSASSLIGMVLTPALAAALLHTGADVSISGLEQVVLQLQLPFLVGQAIRPWVVPFLDRHRQLIGLVDRIAVLLIVYMAVSAAAGRGVWGTLRPVDLVAVILADMALLASALAILVVVSRRLRLPPADEIAVLFCGGNKGLVTGVSMLGALLPADIAGIAVLPLIMFHQMQLVTSASLASRYARRRMSA